MENRLAKSTELLVSFLTERYKGWEGTTQFRDTAKRLARMYEEFCWTPERIRQELDKQLSSFENKFDEMLVQGPIEVWTLCPHHLLPCEFRVTVGYIPSNNRVLGLSKFARVSEVLAKRPIMQEQYSMDLAKELEEKLKPEGLAVYITGIHGCMTSRGVRQRSPVVTSVLKGKIKTESATRAEFLAIARTK